VSRVSLTAADSGRVDVCLRDASQIFLLRFVRKIADGRRRVLANLGEIWRGSRAFFGAAGLTQ